MVDEGISSLRVAFSSAIDAGLHIVQKLAGAEAGHESPPKWTIRIDGRWSRRSPSLTTRVRSFAAVCFPSPNSRGSWVVALRMVRHRVVLRIGHSLRSARALDRPIHCQLNFFE